MATYHDNKNGASVVVAKRKKKALLSDAEIRRVEEIRAKLGFNETNFGVQLGYSYGAYCSMLRENKMPFTVKLAAEHLLATLLPPAPAKEDEDQFYFVSTNPKRLYIRPMKSYSRIILDNKHYLLIPTEEVK